MYAAKKIKKKAVATLTYTYTEYNYYGCVGFVATVTVSYIYLLLGTA